jgi:UDP-N-acetylglucosamine 2-epimerase
MYSKNFEVVLSEASNPYGKGGASSKIFEEIKKSNLGNLTIKSFHDL